MSEIDIKKLLGNDERGYRIQDYLLPVNKLETSTKNMNEIDNSKLKWKN